MEISPAKPPFFSLFACGEKVNKAYYRVSLNQRLAWMKMSWADRFFEQFCKSYLYHRWPPCKGKLYGSRQWTKEMAKILEKTARKLGLKRKRTELRRIDFDWYTEDCETPTLSVEHENGYKGIWKEEIPKLLASKANLKVLICYPPKKEHWTIGNRLFKLLRKENKLGRFKEEFLLILGLYEGQETNDPKQFTCYKYAPEITVRRLRLE